MFSTLEKMMRQLEAMAGRQVHISHAINLLEAAAKTYDELVVINVIRESYSELALEESSCKTA